MAPSDVFFTKDIFCKTKLWNKNKKLLTIITSFKEWKIYCNDAINLDILTNYKKNFNFVIMKELN